MNLPSPSPTQHTLNTPELLELILTQLDPRTLLTAAQLTCRTWRTLIQTSLPLQEALFFRPAKLTPNSPNKDRTAVNPLLAWAFPPFTPHYTPPENGWIFPFHALDFIARPEKQPAYMRPEASWRRMLVQQRPPVRSVGLLTSCSGMAGEEVCLVSWKAQRPDGQAGDSANDGLRMETLFELLFFNELLPYNYFIGMAWDRIAPRRAEIDTYLERLGKPVVVPEVLVCVYASVGCEESDEEEESPVRALQGVVQGGYHREGLQPTPIAGRGRGWVKGEEVKASGWWD